MQLGHGHLLADLEADDEMQPGSRWICCAVSNRPTLIVRVLFR